MRDVLLLRLHAVYFESRQVVLVYQLEVKSQRNFGSKICLRSVLRRWLVEKIAEVEKVKELRTGD